MQIEVIDSFKDNYAFLSNFYATPVNGFKTSEHAYQAAKMTNIQDADVIKAASTPGIAKRLGLKMKMREDWEDVKVQIMYNIVRDKFNHNTALREKLLATGSAYLEEGNTWGDTFWGVCNGVGLNMLGQILMLVRAELYAKYVGL